MINLIPYFNQLDEIIKEKGIIIVTPRDSESNDLASAIRKLRSDNIMPFDYEDDVEYAKDEAVIYLKQNYKKAIDDSFLTIFIDDKYKDLLHFIVENRDYEEIIYNLDDFAWMSEFLEKYFVGKKYSNLSDFEKEALGEPNIDKYMIDNDTNECTLDFNFGISIPGRINEDGEYEIDETKELYCSHIGV